MKILVLNAGSSSQKCCLYSIEAALPDQAPAPLWQAAIEGTAATPVQEMLQTIWSGPSAVLKQPGEMDIVGHRVVHGGRDYLKSTIINDEVKAAIKRLSSLAPAHNPAALAGIQAVEKLLPGVPQVAVFDTAFHSSLPDAAAVYPGPYEWLKQGIRRYGFHGISHEDCARRAALMLGKDLTSLRLITCHLGNGCSLAAILYGKSVDTTMGFTPLEGLMMGSRSGTVDPGILLYLMREKGYTAPQLDEVLNGESGLKGISGLSGDMREIMTAVAAGNERAHLAFDIYAHRLRGGIGAMLATLGGVDALVFTGGVGEHCAPLHSAVCSNFAFLGLQLDEQQNQSAAPDGDIAEAGSAVRVLLVEAQEDWAIARQCWQIGHNHH